MEEESLLINPTLACGNPLNYMGDLDILEEIGNKILHIDIMDGHYVPNLCFDLNTIKAIKERYNFLLDVHLMVTNPFDYIEALYQMRVHYISFHLDATAFSIKLIKQIQHLGMKAGVVINPSQSIELAYQVLPYVDYVLTMAVEPGFSGQAFIPETLDKVKKLRDFREQSNLDFLIEVDGGIDHINSVECINAGADILVSGAFGVFQNRKGLKEDYLAFQKIVKQAAK